MSLKAYDRTTLPASTSKLERCPTGGWGSHAGTAVANQGTKHARNINAAAESVIAKVAPSVDKYWADKQSEWKRGSAKEARMRGNVIQAPKAPKVAERMKGFSPHKAKRAKRRASQRGSSMI